MQWSLAYINSNDTMGPLLTLSVQTAMRSARRAGERTLRCSLDLAKSETTVSLEDEGWCWRDQVYPYPQGLKERTIYLWDGHFEPVARFSTSLIKLIPTHWGPPTFEIDGIKMLPSEHVSPLADARRKVGLVEPRGKRILDTCGGLGYFAACALDAQASRVLSFEVNPDVLWLRSLNPWSPDHRWAKPHADLAMVSADVSAGLESLPSASFDAILHDPPRFGIAGELYSQSFYGQLARVIKPRGRLFHYTGSPNKLTTHRDLAREVAARLRRAGFCVDVIGDGLLAQAPAR
jgi:predicted methyltransferase